MPAAERIIDFTDAAVHLSMRHEQLVIRRGDDESEVSVPLAELAAVVLTSPRLTATQPALAGLARHGCSVIVCDDGFQPAGMMLPLVAHTTQTQRMIAQVRASQPVNKRIWRDIVQAKVRAQAVLLQQLHKDDGGLAALARAVRSGDPMNIEAQAAQRYWPMLFDDPNFRRFRAAEDQNRLLNYGYAVLRAAIGRALCATGLHPSIGVHHHSRTNPWCLADDVMEPYRPLVDAAAVELVGLYTNACPLDGEAKTMLIGVLTQRLHSDGEERTVFDWISRTAASLAKVFLGEAKSIFYPDGLWREGVQ
ncbi:MAG: type II CRISPR-associated endonuclease Cas1 [Phycisphaerales bacterium]